MAPLSTPFYRRYTEVVAHDLLGCLLVTQNAAAITVGRIVETEAYTEDDPASHSYGRRAAEARGGSIGRSQLMFGPAGRAYVYQSYGIHACFNVVTEEAGRGCAVLIRALEPVLGLELMAQRRFPGRQSWNVIDLCRGPGRLSQAMGITVERHNGLPLGDSDGPIVILETDDTVGGIPAGTNWATGYGDVTASERIGIRRATDIKRRFFYTGCRFVSRRRPERPKSSKGH